MKNYVGIDLGTTNSVICSYDGETTRLWKSPEQNDVTPSAIYIDRRGNKYVGRKAYDNAPHSPGNSALLFKRFMGTSTPIELAAVNVTKTPEECSAEILSTVFGYLSEEIRNDPDVGTVITVPAAFNQMQKDATRQAADMAGIGRVALMQEPVAAVMAIMQARTTDGMFLVFDIGGGTLDTAIAESIGGRVSLLAHGGIAMCGGRDFDRALMDSVVRPWLTENFNLPEDWATNPDFRSLHRLATWAAERAKIELSARESTNISLTETELRVRDRSGDEIYLDIPIDRSVLDPLIEPKVRDAIQAARDTLKQAGLDANDLEKIVFVGGPTGYKPLRDRVAFELGIPGSNEVNPMTAVAEGAAVFAESIDWSSERRGRKSSRGQLAATGPLAVNFNYVARTPDVRARISVQIEGAVAEGAEFQVESLDTGWSSGRLPLAQGSNVDVTLTKAGDNVFKVFLFDSKGGPISLPNDRIVITRTAATIDAIPASYSIGIEVQEKQGGRAKLDWLVRAGDHLPKKGTRKYSAATALRAGGSGTLRFKVWEGEIEDTVTDNRFVGELTITGADFDDGVIPFGAELRCDFEVLDSGNIIVEVSVPSIGGSFRSGNFFSSVPGRTDYSIANRRAAEEAEATASRLDAISEKVSHPALAEVRRRLDEAATLAGDSAAGNRDQDAMENAKEASDKVVEARRLLAEVRKDRLRDIRQIDLDSVREFFDEHLRSIAKPSEESAFDNLSRTAERAMDDPRSPFEDYIDQLRGMGFGILWRQDWFVVERFKWLSQAPHLFPDGTEFEQLVRVGAQALAQDDIDRLRQVVAQLDGQRISTGSDAGMLEMSNIMLGH